MAIEIEGRIIDKLQPVKGESARGTWIKQDFILEYEDGKLPARVCINVWGEDMVRNLESYTRGDSIKASLKLSSREYNGKWYTEIRAWRIERTGDAPIPSPSYSSAPAPTPAPPSAPAPSYDDIPSGMDSFSERVDDLPF